MPMPSTPPLPTSQDRHKQTSLALTPAHRHQEAERLIETRHRTGARLDKRKVWERRESETEGLQADDSRATPTRPIQAFDQVKQSDRNSFRTVDSACVQEPPPHAAAGTTGTRPCASGKLAPWTCLYRQTIASTHLSQTLRWLASQSLDEDG